MALLKVSQTEKEKQKILRVDKKVQNIFTAVDCINHH